MKLPRGQLVRSRVVSNPGTALATVLDRRLTGYALLEPQNALLLDADERGVITFEAGVPVLAYHTGTDRGGVEALADLAVPGPYSADVFELSAEALAEVHDTPELAVPPGVPAERVAGDQRLADRTRERARTLDLDAPRRGDDAGASREDPVATFLDDGEKIDAIKEQAREEARQRAREWGLGDELAEADREPDRPRSENLDAVDEAATGADGAN